MTACVLDADVVIAVLDRSDAHHRSAARAVTRMLDDGNRLLLSLVNYAEALVRPAERADTLRTAVDAIAALGLELIAPTALVAREAARLRTSGVTLPDAFALATALSRDASLAAFDAGVRRAAREAGLQVAPARA
jgi:predicted nucleic acid-binding protein